MFKKFLEGFVSIVPFFYRNNLGIRCYPEDIYVNDWKIIGNLLRNIARKTENNSYRNDKSFK
jgi:hypothetical protein